MTCADVMSSSKLLKVCSLSISWDNDMKSVVIITLPRTNNIAFYTPPSRMKMRREKRQTISASFDVNNESGWRAFVCWCHRDTRQEATVGGRDGEREIWRWIGGLWTIVLWHHRGSYILGGMEPTNPHFTSEEPKRGHRQQVEQETKGTALTSAGSARLWSSFYFIPNFSLHCHCFKPFFDL